MTAGLPDLPRLLSSVSLTPWLAAYSTKAQMASTFPTVHLHYQYFKSGDGDTLTTLSSILDFGSPLQIPIFPCSHPLHSHFTFHTTLSCGFESSPNGYVSVLKPDWNRQIKPYFLFQWHCDHTSIITFIKLSCTYLFVFSNALRIMVGPLFICLFIAIEQFYALCIKNNICMPNWMRSFLYFCLLKHFQ